jgi:hypothetical protein
MRDPGLSQSNYELLRQLALVCSGRENHSDHVELRAVVHNGQLLIFWTDTFLQQQGELAKLPLGKESDHLVQALFGHLRAWRERIENRGHRVEFRQRRTFTAGAR